MPEIHKLVNSFAAKDRMLPRPMSEIYENLRDFFIAREGDKVLGCGALHICWGDLVEIKSIAVAEEKQRKGIGMELVNACIEEAKALDIPAIFCLTYEPAFFKRFGFEEVGLMDLPRKVWGECQRCPKYPDCDEIAMLLKLKPSVKAQW